MVLNEPSIRPLRMTPPAKPYSVIVPGAHLMAAFVGQRDAHLRLIEAAYPDVNGDGRNDIAIARANQIEFYVNQS